METLITGEKKPRSGLYTLQFSYIPLGDEEVPEATADASATAAGKRNSKTVNEPSSEDVMPPTDDEDKNHSATTEAASATEDHDAAAAQTNAVAVAADEDPTIKEARLQAINKACATEFGPWTLLCRLRFEGDVMGRIKGSVKVKTRNSNNGAATPSGNSPTNLSAAASVCAAAPSASPPAETMPAAPPSSSGITGDHTATTSVIGGAATATFGCSAVLSPSQSSSYQQPSSSGTRACIQPDSVWKPSDELRLVISLDRLEGSVVGLRNDLSNVVLHCHSHVTDGWSVGSASVVLSSGQQLKTSRKLQFLLKEYTGVRCAKCMDPVDDSTTIMSSSTSLTTGTQPFQDSLLSGSASALGCGSCNYCVQYCSQQCMESHMPGHLAMCDALKLFGFSQNTSSTTAPQGSGPHASGPSPIGSSLMGGGRAAANFAGAEFFVYWRCVKGCTFELIADHNNPLGVPYEIQLNPLKDAREGLDYAFLPATAPASSSAVTNSEDSPATAATSTPNVSPQELNELNVSIFFAVAQSSLAEGALLLTAACLNHLFAFCECVDNLVLSYFQFYDVCVRDQFEGVRHISCLSEYTMYVRTTFELGQTLLEWALKAPFASLFWQRLVAAKDVLVSLYNFNASLQFAPSIQSVKSILVPDQQRQTLHLLAKIFIVMASRAPKDLAQRLLRRAEECYKDSIDEDKPRKNFREMGLTCFKLAALATLFDSNDDKQKSKLFKDEGLEMMKIAARAAESAQRASAAAAAARAEAAAAAIGNNIAAAAAAAAAVAAGGTAGVGQAQPQS